MKTTETTTRRQAFTLVELLVVIGIIAVLVSMLLPALNQARRRADIVFCQSNLKQVGAVLLMYAQDNHGIPFPVGKIKDIKTGGDGYPDGLGTNVPLDDRWTSVCFRPAVPNPRVMLCPVDMELGQQEITDTFLGSVNKDPWKNKHSYILNKHLIYENVRWGRPVPNVANDNIVVLGEKKLDYFDYYMECDGIKNTGTSVAFSIKPTPDINKVEKYRHGVIGRSNQLYLDFHVDNRTSVLLDPNYYDEWQVRDPQLWGQ